jgi:uncharacterized LabA/DUF88 family protein
MAQRVSFFIDGFNMFHSLKSNAWNCRWLDLRALCEKFLKSGEELGDVYYFTAYASWNPVRAMKHKTYINALMARGIKPVFGKFKKITRKCNLCHRSYITHEEKRSDVNIALYLFNSAAKNNFDKAVIVSGDSDMIPAIELEKADYPDKKIGVMVPYGLMAREIRDASDFQLKIKLGHLENSLLPKEMETSGGPVAAPENWLP